MKQFKELKKQLEQLSPLDNEIRSYQDIIEKNNQIKKSVEYLQVFFAEKKSVILDKEIQSHTNKKERLAQKIVDISNELEGFRDKRKTYSSPFMKIKKAG